jgi:hypothetical protein
VFTGEVTLTIIRFGLNTWELHFMRRIWVVGALVVLSVSSFGLQGAASGEPPQRLDPLIQKIVGEISEESIVQIMKKLESLGTRHTLSDPNQPTRGVGAAWRWIHDELKSYSPRLDVSYDIHTIPQGGRIWREVEIRNVVAVLPGKADPDRWIMIGGHYDSLNLRVPEDLRSDQAKAVEIDAPGVTDNASGTALTMECARIMSRYEFDATLVFVAFAAEEQGLWGARGLAQRLNEKGQEVQAILNSDIIGSVESGNGVIENRRILVFSEDPMDSPSRQIARFVKRIGERYYPELSVDMIFRHDRFGRGGDHTAFNQQGYAGVRFTTPRENFANQHSPTDTFDNTSSSFTAKVTRLNAAAAAAMALAPRSPQTAAPRELNLSRAERPGVSRGSGYDAVLRWRDPIPAPDLAGFIVVMRSTTDPDWRREVFVGNTNQFTFPNTPIDQLVFGVKSVDRDGHESPVSAYVARSR